MKHCIMQHHITKRRTLNRYGFTLIELLVIIAIIAILSAILFPVIACLSMSLYQTGAARLYRGHYGANRSVMPVASADGLVAGI